MHRETAHEAKATNRTEARDEVYRDGCGRLCTEFAMQFCLRSTGKILMPPLMAMKVEVAVPPACKLSTRVTLLRP